MANIPISSLPVITSVTNAMWIPVDDGSTSSKITVQNFNATGTASAQAYATQAANSASAAATSASQALGYKNQVDSALNNAATDRKSVV